VKTAPDYSLYLVIGEEFTGGRPLLEVIRSAVKGGVTMVQLREKTATGGRLVELARGVREVLEPAGIPLIINDCLDVALASGAAGVHLGQGDLACVEARRLTNPGFLIGVSVSTVEEARRAAQDGADYLGVSPVFDTATKLDTPAATGLEGLRTIRAAVKLPLVRSVASRNPTRQISFERVRTAWLWFRPSAWRRIRRRQRGNSGRPSATPGIDGVLPRG